MREAAARTKAPEGGTQKTLKATGKETPTRPRVVSFNHRKLACWLFCLGFGVGSSTKPWKRSSIWRSALAGATWGLWI